MVGAGYTDLLCIGGRLFFSTKANQNEINDLMKKAVASKPDLILLDLLMPVMEGHEALLQIRRIDELKAIKVIGVSAAVADRERTEAFAADCDDFISKPVDTALLLEKVKAQLEIEWIEAEDGGRGTNNEGRETRDE